MNMFDDFFEMLKKYNTRNWVVHPLSRPTDDGNSPGKRPLISRWQVLSKTPDDLGNYIRKGYNLGLVCGKASGVTVLDIDHELFMDDLFNGFELETLKSRRTEGKGHIYFKYNQNLPASKHHDLGIEILSDGSNIVLPPSIHRSGDVYRWNDINTPLIDMPKELERRILKLFKTETELKQIIGKCRHCFRQILKDKPNVHGAEGREYMLAVCTDLKANGATEEHAKMFAKLMYGREFDEKRTLQEWRNIDPSKTWQCETLKMELPAYINLDECQKCEKRRQKEANKKLQTQKQLEEEIEVPQHIKDRAAEILEKGDPIQFVFDQYHKMHVGDDNTAKSLLVSKGIQSVLNSDGMHPKLSGQSGKGKSHCCKAIAHLLPKEYCRCTTLSDKAIYYLNLRPGTVVFSDDVNLSESLQNIIKRATTNFQEGDRYTTMDMNRKIQELWIPPRISWWLTSVDDDQEIQLLNRTFGVGIDESSGQDKEVVSFQLSQAENGEVGFPENDDVEVCRELFRQIAQQTFLVKIPYASKLEWKDKENRRNLPVFLDIIKAFAVLRFKQRPIVDGFLIANIQDYEDARALYCSRAENQALKLTEAELKICRKLHELGECDTYLLQQAIGLSQGRVHQLIHGRKDREGSGLLHKVNGLSFEKRTVRENDDDVRTTKNYYSLINFDVLGSYDNVVNLPEHAKKEHNDFYHNYTTITPIITNKTNNNEQTITTITQINNIESNKPDSLKNPEFSNHSLCENQKMCKNGNSQPTDTVFHGNSAGKNVVIVPADNGNSGLEKNQNLRDKDHSNQNLCQCGQHASNVSRTAIGKETYWCDQCYSEKYPF